MGEYIKTEIIDGSVALIQLDRPKAMNALCNGLMEELSIALQDFDRDSDIGCMIVTGNEKSFAAGMDIKEMQSKDFSDTYYEDMLVDSADRIMRCRKPIIAAVAGYALGGGCELAMMCDIMIVADNAKFGQPEVTIGTMPGFGGSQRLTRLIGKAKSMEMCLTGRMMEAEEAMLCGIASRLVPAEDLMEETVGVAKLIASKSQMSTMMIKEAVNRAEETSLSEGLRFERRLFHASFSTKDQKEGMQAFIDKRNPDFINN